MIKDIQWTALAVTVGAAGLVAAVVEMAPVLPLQAAMGVSPVRLFQSIAFGIEGRSAFKGGMPSAVLGALIHLLISVGFALAYTAASYRWDSVWRSPWRWGIGYGLLAYAIMNFVVLPLTPIGFHPPAAPLVLLESVLVHVFAFGVPIALVVACRRRRGDILAGGA